MIIDLTFNTSRLYQAHGQVIRATYDSDTHELRFDDFSRMISGVYTDVELEQHLSPPYYAQSPERFARFVMSHYDRGGYEWAPCRTYDLEDIQHFRL